MLAETVEDRIDHTSADLAEKRGRLRRWLGSWGSGKER